MATQTRPIITRGNDLTFEINRITGRNPTTNAVANYPDATIQGWITTSRESDTALGAVTKTWNAIGGAGSGIFVPHFEASEADTIITAALALVPPIEDGQDLWLIVKGTGQLRRAFRLVYKEALEG
jgi:hypothetical protein